MAHVHDHDARERRFAEGDREAWERVQTLAREKYGWGDGLPVEIIPDASG